GRRALRASAERAPTERAPAPSCPTRLCGDLGDAVTGRRAPSNLGGEPDDLGELRAPLLAAAVQVAGAWSSCVEREACELVQIGAQLVDVVPSGHRAQRRLGRAPVAVTGRRRPPEVARRELLELEARVRLEGVAVLREHAEIVRGGRTAALVARGSRRVAPRAERHRVVDLARPRVHLAPGAHASPVAEAYELGETRGWSVAGAADVEHDP